MRHRNTIQQLTKHPEVFDRITKNKQGGRVGFFERMPRWYDNKSGLPWREVKGRYWYPWRKNDR